MEPGSQESILAKNRLRTVIFDEGGINSQVMEKILANLITQVAQKDALSFSSSLLFKLLFIKLLYLNYYLLFAYYLFLILFILLIY